MKSKINTFWQDSYLNFRKLRDDILKPISQLLIGLKVTPNMVTVFRFLLALIIPVILGWNYWVVVVLMALNLLLDGVDGSMARISGKSSYKGKVLDLFTDNATFVLFLLGLIFWKISDGFWSAFYLVNFVLAIFFNLKLFTLKEDGVVLSKSRYIVLVAFLILTVSGINWIDYACVFCAVYLFVHNIFLGYKFIRKL